jgi:hypothetical protein
MTKSILSAIAALLILLSIGVSIYYQSTLGDSENDYKIVCIYGHKYYKSSFFSKGFLAIKLDDEGRPADCIIK